MRTVVDEQRRRFGAKLKTLREAKGMGVRQFARAIPVAPSSIPAVKNGRAGMPTDAVMTRMAEILEVPPQTLMIQAGRLPPDVRRALRSHPAIPPILGALPGMTLADAQTFGQQALASLPQATTA